jgi:hypothetical protein
MTTLNILTALFIMASVYSMTKPRFHIFVAVSALIAAPTVMGIVDGVDGLIYSLVGAGMALFLTAPLTAFKLVSRTEVLISAALGGMLGGLQYAAVFGIATAFLLVQRILRIDPSLAAAGSVVSPLPYGAGLLAFDETSALVEIEAMKLLRKDNGDSAGPSHAEGWEDGNGSAPGARLANAFPWCAKLALATLAVLMIGNSI